MTAAEVGNSKPDIMRGSPHSGWAVPEPTMRRYHGYVVDMYYQIDEARKYKAKWFNDRDSWKAANKKMYGGSPDDGDMNANWAKTPMSKDLIGMEQWCTRQADMYAAAAQVERDRLIDIGILPVRV